MRLRAANSSGCCVEPLDYAFDNTHQGSGSTCRPRSIGTSAVSVVEWLATNRRLAWSLFWSGCGHISTSRGQPRHSQRVPSRRPHRSAHLPPDESAFPNLTNVFALPMSVRLTVPSSISHSSTNCLTVLGPLASACARRNSGLVLARRSAFSLTSARANDIGPSSPAKFALKAGSFDLTPSLNFRRNSPILSSSPSDSACWYQTRRAPFFQNAEPNGLCRAVSLYVI